jgi:hypothetical protein
VQERCEQGAGCFHAGYFLVLTAERQILRL